MTQTHDTLSSLFDDIADAIRAKTGSSAQIVADDFPDEIAAISGGGGGGGASGVVYITDELDEHGGIVRHLTTDGATITDTTDAHGGIVRSITGAEVRLQVKTVTPGATDQVITADAGYDALGKVIVEAGAGSDMMIVEIENINGTPTADHTFAEIFEAVNGGTPVFLHIPAAGGDDWAEEYATDAYVIPVVRVYKYTDAYRIAAAIASIYGNAASGSVNNGLYPAIYLMQASNINSNPTFYRMISSNTNYISDTIG